MGTILEWLETLKLERYADAFGSMGFVDMVRWHALGLDTRAAASSPSLPCRPRCRTWASPTLTAWASPSPGTATAS